MTTPLPSLPAITRDPSRPGLGLIGAGAFGSFCLPHLRPFFRIHLADPRPDLPEIAARHGVRAASIAEAAAQPFVLLAVPVAQVAAAGAAIAPHLRPGALVVDTCSLKLEPLRLLREILPNFVDLAGTHPLFGPNSGRDGIAGLRVTVCPEPMPSNGAPSSRKAPRSAFRRRRGARRAPPGRRSPPG